MEVYDRLDAVCFVLADGTEKSRVYIPKERSVFFDGVSALYLETDSYIDPRKTLSERNILAEKEIFMKLTCDLCGSALQMNLGGQGATCTSCGLTYSMERLREMLTGQTPVKPEPPKPEPVKPEPPKPVPPKPDDEIIYDVQDWTVVPPAPQPDTGFNFRPEQFVMENNGRGNGDLCGMVRQGGIGLGDSVYIDGDYAHPYTVYSINDDSDVVCAKAGKKADLFLVQCPKKIWKNARMVTGAPDPVANAYNYPGTVKEYFSCLLEGTFGEYEIRCDVPKDGLNIPVNYLFCWGGEPVAAVFLIDSNDNKARYQVEKAARIFAPEGVACTHFFENYRNDMPYVVDRVRGVLG